MSCTSTCIQPSPSQAHCGACHVTFGGITGFDRHRRDGQCLTPEAIGHTDNGRGVYRLPMTEARAAQLAAMRTDAPSGSHRTPQTAENGSGVVGYGSEASSGSTALSGGNHLPHCDGWFDGRCESNCPRNTGGAESESGAPEAVAPKPRIRACVEAWPDCETGLYDPRCCRFPKSCSATAYDPEQVTEEYLEDPR